MYLEIAETGNVSLLNSENNIEAWEKIVEQNCKANGSDEYGKYIYLARSYALTVNEYIGVNAAISKLMLKVDMDMVQYLTNKGYKIDTSASESYAESLVKASHKAANLLTRINMKKGEMLRVSKEKHSGKTLEEILAALSYSIGFPIGEDITLARFNEYNRILRVRAEQEKHGRIK